MSWVFKIAQKVQVLKDVNHNFLFICFLIQGHHRHAHWCANSSLMRYRWQGMDGTCVSATWMRCIPTSSLIQDGPRTVNKQFERRWMWVKDVIPPPTFIHCYWVYLQLLSSIWRTEPADAVDELWFRRVVLQNQAPSHRPKSCNWERGEWKVMVTWL